MAHFLTGIDHTVVTVRDLEAARETYARLGFSITPRGRHIGWATGNYCIMFGANYIELLGIAEPGGFTAGLEEMLAAKGEGLHKIVLGSDDAEATRASFAAAGLNPSDVQSLKRELQLPDGIVLPAFALVHLPPHATPPVSMFVCQHLSAELLRQPAWLLHPNGATHLAGCVVVCDDPLATEAAYETLFGAGSAVRTDRMIAARVGREHVLFVTPTDLATLFPDLEHDESRPTPYIAGMRLRVHNPEAAARYFSAQGIEHARALDGTVLVPAEAAHGVFLEFSSRA
ncbi:VOC family protein [Ferrovibrio sp.]|uniref:VOC family protein n=1 Tax=Ferrovibrio sp. TaxID=1917215 RepID=UPI001B50D590|nr:VOC family protein [Ferrovibrio sp.]MBP7065346.1 VOC family protein [Ferrovibrio sp.]